MRLKVVLLSLIVICSFTHGQSISIGVNHNIAPVLSVDLMNERISLDIGFDYDVHTSKRHSIDSTWTVSPGYVYEYTFESLWDYTVNVISPILKVRYSLSSNTQSSPFFYASILYPIVDVDIESYTKSSLGMSDNSESRKKDLEIAFGGTTLAIGAGVSSKLNDKIKLLFDCGYSFQESGYDDSSTSGDASNGAYSFEEVSTKQKSINTSITLLYTF